jgi:hypothetical protein
MLLNWHFLARAGKPRRYAWAHHMALDRMPTDPRIHAVQGQSAHSIRWSWLARLDTPLKHDRDHFLDRTDIVAFLP